MSKLSAAIAAAALFYAGHASAVTTFNDRMAFAAQGQGAMSFLTLDNIGLDDAVPLPFNIGPLQINGATEGDPNWTSAYYFAGIHAGHPGVHGDVNGSAWMQMRLSPESWVTWSSASSFQMIGFDLRTYFDDTGNLDAGETVFFETDTGENGAFTLSSLNEASFLGLKFNAPVHSITFSSLDNVNYNYATWFGVDNLQTFQTAAVPEPASLAMLLGGLGAIGMVARRRKAA